MKSNNEVVRINELISQLELKQKDQLLKLQEEALGLVQQIKPVHLLKKAISDLVFSKPVSMDVLNLLLGMATGYLTKKTIIGNSGNPLKIFMGNAIQATVGIFIAEHADAIRLVGNRLISLLKSRKRAETET